MIVCLILLITFIFAWAIPFVLIATAVGNNGRTRRALNGTYDEPGGRDVSDKALGAWLGALALVGFGLYALAQAPNALGVVIGLVMIGGGVALRPWRLPWRPVDEG